MILFKYVGYAVLWSFSVVLEATQSVGRMLI